PAYGDYTTRTRLSEVALLAGGVKADILDAYGTDGTMPAPGSLVADRVIGQIQMSRYVAAGGVAYQVNSIAPLTDNEALITVTLGSNANAASVKTWEFRFTASASGFAVSCNGGTLESNLRPSSCR